MGLLPLIIDLWLAIQGLFAALLLAKAINLISESKWNTGSYYLLAIVVEFVSWLFFIPSLNNESKGGLWMAIIASILVLLALALFLTRHFQKAVFFVSALIVFGAFWLGDYGDLASGSVIYFSVIAVGVLTFRLFRWKRESLYLLGLGLAGIFPVILMATIGLFITHILN